MLRAILTDRAAVYGVATKVIQGAASLASAVFILKFFSPAVQGYYYTFATLLALQIFLELGLSTVINIFAAHEWAKLSLDQHGAIGGDQHALARLRSLTQGVFRWYLTGGLLLLILLIFVGLWFFGENKESETVSWRYPWFAMCVLAAISFSLTPAWALLTGCGQLVSLNAFRMIEIAIRYAALWTCMAWGASLWSVVASVALSIAAGIVFLALRYRRFFEALLESATASDFSWRRDVAPLQLRYAVGWLGGYFAFSLFTPVMFHFHGAEDAGRMGMTWALVMGLSGIASTWLQAQAPRFAMMVAREEYENLNRTAWRTMLIGALIFLFGACVGLGGLLLLEMYRPEIAGRLIPFGCVFVFLVAEFLHLVSMVQSTYLRSFKEEPFLGISLVTGLIVGVGTVLMTPTMGALGPAVSYLSGIVVALLWGTMIFVRKTRQLKSPSP